MDNEEKDLIVSVGSFLEPYSTSYGRSPSSFKGNRTFFYHLLRFGAEKDRNRRLARPGSGIKSYQRGLWKI